MLTATQLFHEDDYSFSPASTPDIYVAFLNYHLMMVYVSQLIRYVKPCSAYDQFIFEGDSTNSLKGSILEMYIIVIMIKFANTNCHCH